MNRKLSAVFVAALAAALSPTAARAACDDTHTDATIAYMNKLNALPNSAYQVLKALHEQRYSISSNDWVARGWTADVTYLKTIAQSDYGKHFHAAVFAENAVTFGPRNETVFQWNGQVAFVDSTTRGFHGDEDYAAIVRGTSPARQYIGYRSNTDINGTQWFPVSTTGVWHFPNVHFAADGDGSAYASYLTAWKGTSIDLGFLGTYYYNSSNSRDVATYCPMYNPKSPEGLPVPFATPAAMASTLVHEGWHSRDMPPMTDHHQQVPPEEGGRCTYLDDRDGTGNCDTWYTHEKLAFDEGDTFFSLNATGVPTNGDPSKRRPPLSANQLQVEYLCDIADSGEDWLPLSVVHMAAIATEVEVGDRFNNLDLPQQACGIPTPLYAVPVGTRDINCGNRTRCDSTAECGPNEICHGGCCYLDLK